MQGIFSPRRPHDGNGVTPIPDHGRLVEPHARGRIIMGNKARELPSRPGPVKQDARGTRSKARLPPIKGRIILSADVYHVVEGTHPVHARDHDVLRGGPRVPVRGVDELTLDIDTSLAVAKFIG